MAPVGFPVMMIAPAIVLDLLWTRITRWNGWAQALSRGRLPRVVCPRPVAVRRLPHVAAVPQLGVRHSLSLYMMSPTSPSARSEFFAYEASRAAFWRGMAIAAVTAMATTGSAWPSRLDAQDSAVKTRVVAAALLALASAQPAAAYRQSDVYFEGSAGDYRMLVVVRMPRVIPGVAEIEVRSLSAGLRDVQVTPMRIRGLGPSSPVADIAKQAAGGPGVTVRNSG
jgi:hypothetical protein